MFHVLKKGHVINKITTIDIAHEFLHSKRSDDYPFARKEEEAQAFIVTMPQYQEITEKINPELIIKKILEQMQKKTLTKIIYQYKRVIFVDNNTPEINLLYTTVFNFTPDYQFVKISKTCKKIEHAV